MANNCNCGETCVGGQTCHCNDNTTFICPGGNCSIPNNGNCGCNYCPPEHPLPETHRVQRLIAPSRDTHTNWNDKDPVIKEGVLGFTKDRKFNGSLEYFIGDGVHKYSELTKYAAAEASTSKKANTLVLRDGSGKIDKPSLPDDLTDLVNIPDATPTTKGVVKASTTTAADNAVKSDDNGGLDGWKDAIIDAIIAEDGSGGLGTDSNGNLVVDFNQMPTDKFEALLKSLKMLIPLEANLDLYVDTGNVNAADTIVDGRGTQNKPFKTIQACVNFATQTYALGTHNITIYVAEGTYSENVSLPQYTTTSGIIEIKALDNDHPPTITNSSAVDSVITVSSNVWRLRRLIINGQFAENGSGNPHYPSCVLADGRTASARIYGCTITSEYVGNTPVATFDIRHIAADSGGAVNFYTMAGYHNVLSCTKGDASHAYMLHALRDSKFMLVRGSGTDDGIRFEYPCSGTVDAFCYLNDRCSFYVGGSGTLPQLTGTVTGKAYTIYGGSTITLPSSGFPGDTSTSTVESATYCWVR